MSSLIPFHLDKDLLDSLDFVIFYKKDKDG